MWKKLLKFVEKVGTPLALVFIGYMGLFGGWGIPQMWNWLNNVLFCVIGVAGILIGYKRLKK
jgi:hypothetical protein